ncbi:MAG: hypothetical protein WC869_02145 [Phycisphaerae bacterium]
MGIRKRIYDILDPGHHDGILSKIANYIIYSLIFLNVVAIVLESLPAIRNRWQTAFYHFEVFTVMVFSVEYLMRLWCCVESPKYASSVVGRLR